MPLDVDGWEIVETLEHLSLYDEFAERLYDALQLIREGQQHWANHQQDGEWSVEASRVVTEVRRLSSNIRQRFDSSLDDLPRCIQWIVGESSESSVTDSQYVAALAIDRACRVVEVLGRWLTDFDADLYAGSPTPPSAFDQNEPVSFAAFLSEVRREQAQLEIEARENVADLMGAAKYYATLASVYASPLLSISEKSRISAAARKAGNSSVVIRREATADRNQSICTHAKRLLRDGRSEREIVGIIVGTDSALKTPGGSDKLSAKQIRNILLAGGVFS